MTDLFESKWRLDDLGSDATGPFGPPRLSDAEKKQLWTANAARKPQRVPVTFGLNNRVALLDERFGGLRLSYKDIFDNARSMLLAQLYFMYVARRRFHLFCDLPTELPEAWEVGLSFQNVLEAWFFGSPVRFQAGQVPDALPAYQGNNKRAVFDIDITEPLKRDPFKRLIEMYEFLTELVQDKTFLERPIRITQPIMASSDGPLTIAMCIRGQEIVMDLYDDPAYANQLFDFIVEASVLRWRASQQYFGVEQEHPGCFADDSIALLSVAQYREFILPHHRRWYEGVGSKPGHRSIHLCGDATRHFPTLRDEVGVTYFDTGFPVDFKALRETLGPDVGIAGGVEVQTLLAASPQQVYQRAQDILESGINVRGRFILREANNMPTNVPWANLAAMYQAAFDFGRF